MAETMDRQKTAEQLRQEMYDNLKRAQSGQHLCEVAMPGVVRNVNMDEVDKEQ